MNYDTNALIRKKNGLSDEWKVVETFMVQLFDLTEISTLRLVYRGVLTGREQKKRE
eukprot:XP_001708983.1 Hypothetical protein GL50803_112541 [Giardia lamblia ATCC 50803]